MRRQGACRWSVVVAMLALGVLGAYTSTSDGADAEEIKPGDYGLTVSPDRSMTGLRGRVTRTRTGEPIAGATVRYIGPGMEAQRTVMTGSVSGSVNGSRELSRWCPRVEVV